MDKTAMNIHLASPSFLTVPDGIPSNDGDFLVSRFWSETAELDKFFHFLNLGDTYLLPVYCKIIGEKEPDKWKEDNVIRVIILALMTKVGHMISRDILNKLPKDKPIEFYDFTKTDSFCTDNGRLFWEVIYDKWDISFKCESRNRYAKG